MPNQHVRQSDTIAFLASPAAHAGGAVERIDTHASIIFLTANRAWKLKRAVRYDYLDYSTPDRRRTMCEAELAVNQPHAPQIYRRVAPVTRDAHGQYAIDGAGEPVEWLIEMARFDQAQLFDRLATQGRLDLSLMPELAAAIAHLHGTAEPRGDHGGYAGMAWVIDGNAAAFGGEAAQEENAALAMRVIEASRSLNERLRATLDARRTNGRVRRCHGDLHLGNIVRDQGRPTLFDAIEFNDKVACVDVLYDLSFVLMDLWRLSLARHANALLNAYVLRTADIGGLAALPLFMGCRATVRAKTLATAAGLETDATRRRGLIDQSRGYLELADRLLHPSAPSLVAVGGLSGSGKSVLSVALAPDIGPAPGALVLRSDEVRKQLLGVDPLTRLGPEGYAPDVSSRVYDAISARAAAILENRHGVVADATFLRSSDRLAIEGVARKAGAPFVGLWLDAPEDTRLARARRRTHDPSDADADVVRHQSIEDSEGMRWTRLDASGAAEDVLAAARRLVPRPDSQ
jgi:aminoglycoside phosphotransferase family enzyme/predicted kinase